MSRCPKLDYESNSVWGPSSDKYICTLTGIRMDVDSGKVDRVCKSTCGDDYKNCPDYQKYSR